MTDVIELRKKLDDSGYKLRFVAKQCGLSYQGFLPKMRGERDFTQSEISTLRKLLNLTVEEADEIFFHESRQIANGEEVPA